MVQFGKFKPTLKLAPQNNPYEIFFISIKLGKGWILFIGRKNVKLIHT